MQGWRRGPGSASLNQFNLRDSGVQLFHRGPGSRLARCYVLLQPRRVCTPSPRWRPRRCCIIHRNEDRWAPCYLLRRSELKSGPPLICSHLKKRKKGALACERNPLIESLDLEIYCGNTFLSSAAFCLREMDETRAGEGVRLSRPRWAPPPASFTTIQS